MKTRRHTYTVILSFIALSVIPIARAGAEGFDPPLPPPGIHKQTRVLLSHLKGGRPDAAADALNDLVVQRRLAGIPNLTPVAAAFISVFDTVEGLTEGQRRELATSAIDLAPDYPGLHFLLARTRLGEGLSGFGPAAAAFFDGLSRIPTHPRVASIYAANVAFYAQGVVLILYIMGAFALLFRYISLFRHDFGDIFPGTASAHFTALDIRESRGGFRSLFRVTSATVLTIIVMIVLLAPVTLGFGLLTTAALWMFLAFPYAGRSERVVAIVATVVIAFIPVAGSVVALPESLENSAAARRWTCINEYCPADWLTEIQLSIVPGSGPGMTEGDVTDPLIAAASGARQWAGNSADEFHKIRINLESNRLVMNSGDGRIRHGNLLIQESLGTCPEKKPDRSLLVAAIASFDTAVQLGAAGEPAWRGLAVAHGLMGDTTQMDSFIQKTLETHTVKDLDFMVRIKTATAASDVCQRFDELVAELRPPAGRGGVSTYLGGKTILGAIRSTPTLVPFQALLLGTISTKTLPIVLGCLMLLGIVLAVLLPPSRRARRCLTCGHVTCPSCSRLTSGFNHCPICLFDKVKPSYLDPEDVQVMMKPRNTQSARRALSVVMSVLIPGSGQLISGKATRGMAMLMLFGLGLELVVFPEFPVVDSFAYVPPSSGGLPVLPPVLLLLAWVWSVLDALVSKGK